MLHRGEKLVRIISALITLGMAGCLILFAFGNSLTVGMTLAYAVAVLACGVFVTSWPWRGNSKARFYALLGVLWTSAAASALLSDQSMTATFYGVAAALSFWSSLTVVASHSDSHTSHAQQVK
jgi:hypothetical protein